MLDETEKELLKTVFRNGIVDAETAQHLLEEKERNPDKPVEQILLEKKLLNEEELKTIKEQLTAHNGRTFLHSDTDAARGAPATSPPTSHVAPFIGKYKIIGLLGKGGMGKVYKGFDPELRRFAAIKVLPEEMASDPENLQRFLLEAEAAAKLSHPNIVAIYEIGQHNRTYFFAMEYVDGQSLRGWIKKYRPSRRKILEVFRRVCLAVHRAHLNGVIHRDIKPANILVTKNGVPKVADFGLAKQIRGKRDSSLKTEDGTVMGTPEYMAPEQAAGKIREIDVRSDVYSLGVVLYELMTGKRPFKGSNFYAVIKQVLFEEPPRPSQVNPKVDWELEAIILKAIAKKKEERYQSARDLADDIERYLRGEPIKAARATWFYTFKKKVARNKPFYGTLFSAVVLLIVMLSLFINAQIKARRKAEAAWRIAERQRREAERQREEAEKQRREAEKQRKEAEKQRREAEKAREKAERERLRAEKARRIAEEAREKAEEARRQAVEALTKVALEQALNLVSQARWDEVLHTLNRHPAFKNNRWSKWISELVRQRKWVISPTGVKGYIIRVVRTKSGFVAQKYVQKESRLFQIDILTGKQKVFAQPPNKILRLVKSSPDGEQVLVKVLPGELICFDSNGRIVWTLKPPKGKVINEFFHLGDRIILDLPSGEFEVYDRRGRRIGHLILPKVAERFYIFKAFNAGPYYVLICAKLFGGSYLFLLNAADLQVEWHLNLSGLPYSYAVKGDTIYLATYESTIDVIDIKNHQRLFSIPYDGTFPAGLTLWKGYLIIADSDGKLRVWRLSDWKLVANIHTGLKSCRGLFKDKGQLYVYGSGGIVKVTPPKPWVRCVPIPWDRHPDSVVGCATNGQTIYLGLHSSLLRAYTRDGVCLWAERQLSHPGSDYPPSAIVIAPNGDLIIQDYDGSIVRWNPTTKGVVWRHIGAIARGGPPFLFMRDRTLIATNNNVVAFLDPKTGNIISRQVLENFRIFRACLLYDDSILAFNPYRGLLIVSKNGVKKVNINIPRTYRIRENNDGHLIAFMKGNLLTLYDPKNWKKLWEHNFSNEVLTAAFLPSNDIVVCMRSGRVLLLDGRSGKEIITLLRIKGIPNNIAISPDGTFFVVCPYQRSEFWIVNIPRVPSQ